RSVRKLRRASKPAILDVEELGDRADLFVNDAEVEIGASASENFSLRDGVSEGVSSALKISVLVAVGIGYGEKNAAKTRTTHLIFRRKISATKKWLSIGKQKTGEWPATLTGNGADGGLVSRINVGPFVAIHFYG